MSAKVQAFVPVDPLGHHWASDAAELVPDGLFRSYNPGLNTHPIMIFVDRFH